MKRLIVGLIICLPFISNAQREHLDEGDDLYRHGYYLEAIVEYKKALEQDVVVNRYHMTEQIAKTYLMLFDYENAELWLSRLVAITGEDDDPENFLLYAKVLSNNQKYKEAKQYFKKYAEKADKKDDLDYYLSLAEWPLNNPDSTWKMDVLETNVETGSRSMGVYPYEDKLIIGVPSIDEFTQKTSFYDLGTVPLKDSVTVGEPKILPGAINHNYYEAAPYISPDGKYLYYTANASEVKKYRSTKKKKGQELSNEGINILKIYRAEKVDGNWGNVMELNINKHDYSSAFPFLSNDGKYIYFASDRPGSLGGFDLYRASKINDSTWSEPMNLGGAINSPYDEMYPSINDTALFYSSKGLPGYGGSDVFYAIKKELSFSSPVNMGIPVNSSKDDFSFVVLPDDNGRYKGYLSSNRLGTHGYDHIFYFSQHPKPVYPDTIRGIAMNKITMNPIDGVEIVLKKYGEKKLTPDYEATTDKSGQVTLILEKKVAYKVTFNKKGYKPQSFEIPATDRDDVLALFGKIQMEPVAEKNTVIQVPNIYFDYDKANIRKESYGVLDNIVKYLNDNPDIKVELSAHTDARGSDYYNLKLSHRRAQSTVDYLVGKGIDKSRLIPKGYGEKKIQNHCKNGVKCSDEEHEFNRRVELKVL